MPRVTRYVIFQLFATFAVSLTGISLVMVLSIMAKIGVEQGLGIDAIFRLMPFALPIAFRFAVPASILMASCSVFGRMAADNEVVAIKSLGISPNVILHPAFIFAIAVSFSLIWVNDVAVTWGAQGMQSVIAESVENVVIRLLKTERSFQNNTFEINVKEVRDKTLVEPRLALVSRGKEYVLEAREARLRTNLEQGTLSILLKDCTVEADGNVYVNPGLQEQTIPLTKATRKDRGEPRISQLGLSKISAEAVAQQELIGKMEQQMAARAALQMLTGDFELMSSNARHADDESWANLHREYGQAQTRLNKLKLEPWRRYAEGFSCFFIVVLGAPLAIKMRTTNFFTTFAMCFFPVLCIYYPVLQWAVTQAKDGIVPPYTVWAGNGVLLLVGSWMNRKILRY